MRWRGLDDFGDRSVPKLFNLRRAARAGLTVPRTVWCLAADAAATPPPEDWTAPLIVRSGSPDEDGDTTSHAGQLRTEVVRDLDGWQDALRAVVDALTDDHGLPRGVVFVQPLVEAVRGGVAFFDGFHYERTTAPGGNLALTDGKSRGEVVRGHLERDEPWSEWLASVGRVFRTESGPSRRIDLEFAETEGGHVLLQVRPALFDVRRNPTLSLANHREILGDLPSPWIVSVVGEAGRHVLDFFARFDRRIAGWGESYAEVVAGRAWMNFSALFRIMDHWGLPRSFVTDGVGGRARSAADRRMIWRRALPSAPRLVALQLGSVATVLRSGKGLRDLDDRLARATSLAELWAVNVAAMELAIRTNFAIGGVLSGAQRVRAALGVRGTPSVVTGRMMARYDALRGLPEREREAGLDAWLADFGHRGPLESDPERPRFAEMRDALLADLAHPGTSAAGAGRPTAWWQRPLFWIDARREAFRDELMQRWVVLRRRMLEEGRLLVTAGHLDAAEDVFQLTREDLDDPAGYRDAVRARRRRTAELARVPVPDTATRARIEAVVREGRDAASTGRDDGRLTGIPLRDTTVEGTVVRADDLAALLAAPDRPLGPGTILVVPTLEPSWAVVFGRVDGVISELGGELSHASILLREARKPAIVNCAGIWDAVRTGDRVRLDGTTGDVTVVCRAREARVPVERA